MLGIGLGVNVSLVAVVKKLGKMELKPVSVLVGPNIAVSPDLGPSNLHTQRTQ